MNWILLKLRAVDLAKAWASVVFPTPGTSSISICDLERRAAIAVLTVSGFPFITPLIFTSRLRILPVSSEGSKPGFP